MRQEGGERLGRLAERVPPLEQAQKQVQLPLLPEAVLVWRLAPRRSSPCLSPQQLPLRQAAQPRLPLRQAQVQPLQQAERMLT